MAKAKLDEEMKRADAYREAMHDLATRPKTCPLCRWSRNWGPDPDAAGLSGHTGICFYNPPTVIWTGGPPYPFFSTYPSVYRDSPACSRFELAEERMNMETGLLALPAKKPKGQGRS